jgi:molybdenum cofactor biosynthesis enzyme MoaA
LEGLEAAKKSGLKVKINTVVIKNKNLYEVNNIISWAHKNNFDISLIETMPMGLTDQDRIDQYISLFDVKEIISKKFTLANSPHKTSGPSRYEKVKETGGLIGFITPLSNNFCSNCNRIRLTSIGKLYMCLGQNDNIDFRNIMRNENIDSLKTLVGNEWNFDNHFIKIPIDNDMDLISEYSNLIFISYKNLQSEENNSTVQTATNDSSISSRGSFIVHK